MLTRNSYIANALLGGPIGLCLAAVLYVLMGWFACATLPPATLEGSMGLCLPSPNEWAIGAPWDFILQLALTGLCVLLAISLNARFSLIPGTGVLYATVFLVVTGTVPWVNQKLSSATLLLCATLVCTRLLFSLYGRRNASRGLCVIFSILSWGSMVQYAFVFLMPIFLLGAIFTGSFRAKEFVGMALGIMAPYWIMSGLGVIDLQSLHAPALANLFKDFAAPGILFYLMAGQALTAFLCLLLTASNAMSPSTTGQQHRSYTAFINLTGIAMVWFMLFDSSNMLAYSATLALCLGFQAARYAALPRHKFAYLPVLVSLPLYIALYALAILWNVQADTIN